MSSSLNEQSVVRVETFSCESSVPLLADAASIDTLFTLELNLKMIVHIDTYGVVHEEMTNDKVTNALR